MADSPVIEPTESGPTQSEPTQSKPTQWPKATWKDQWRWASWVLMAIIAVAALIIGVVDDDVARTQGERVAAISATIMCPQCTGQTVAQSNVAIARTIRADIATRVSDGESDDQIRQAYIDNYGEWIITNPRASGFTSFVWIVPVVAAGLAATALAFAFGRWRRALRAEPTDSGAVQAASDADRALVRDAQDQRRSRS